MERISFILFYREKFTDNMDIFVNANNNLDVLPVKIREYVQEKIELCQPANVHVCDGSDAENQQILDAMEQAGVIRRLKKYKNW